MSNTGKILAAIGAGVAAGAVLAILFAPDKGSETRKKLNEEGKRISGDVKNNLRKGKEKFDDFKEGIEKAIKENVENFA